MAVLSTRQTYNADRPFAGVPDIRLTGRARLWLYEGEAAWTFLTLPPAMAEIVRDASGPRRGFGSVRVRVTLGATSWTTSVFPDKKSGSYVLPLKKSVRDAEGIQAGDTVDFALDLQL